MHKRGGLKPAGKRQESATFLQRSFFDVAVQFFVCCSAAFGPNDFRTAEKPMLQCSFCSAAFRKLQCNFRFRWWHVAGVGFSRRKPKGDGGKGTGKKMSRQFAGSSRIGSSLRVGVGAPPGLELWRGLCAKVDPSPRGEYELTLSEESFRVTPLSER